MKNIDIGRLFENEMVSRGIGKKTPGSGNHWAAKGDIVGENKFSRYLLELKATEAQSYSLKKETIDKIRKEALHKNKEWLILLKLSNKTLAIMDLTELEHILEEESCQEI